jgi:hypothetical protein
MPSKEDVFKGSQRRIKVNPSGGYFHLERAGDISEVNLTDIASALSRQCRYTGHLVNGVEHYSVAEHSVLVSYILEKMGADPVTVFQGLMHDSAEAYLSDIAAPFKGAIGNYYDVEEKIMARIRLRYNLPAQQDPTIKKADWVALFVEARQIVNPDEDDLSTWQGYETYGELSHEFAFPLRCWGPAQARNEFLIRFAQCIDAVYGVAGEGA